MPQIWEGGLIEQHCSGVRAGGVGLPALRQVSFLFFFNFILFLNFT